MNIQRNERTAWGRPLFDMKAARRRGRFEAALFCFLDMKTARRRGGLYCHSLFDMKAVRRGGLEAAIFCFDAEQFACAQTVEQRTTRRIVSASKSFLRRTRKRLTDPPQCDTLMPIVNRNDLPPGKQRWILHRQALADARSRRYFFVRIYHTPAPPVKPTANGGVFSIYAWHSTI